MNKLIYVEARIYEALWDSTIENYYYDSTESFKLVIIPSLRISVSLIIKIFISISYWVLSRLLITTFFFFFFFFFSFFIFFFFLFFVFFFIFFFFFFFFLFFCFFLIFFFFFFFFLIHPMLISLCCFYFSWKIWLSLLLLLRTKLLKRISCCFNFIRPNENSEENSIKEIYNKKGKYHLRRERIRT